MLTANNKTNSATEHYYLYLYIDNNTFIYTQNENTPEIILTIEDENNNEITSISGLTHTTVTDASGASITGFDITNKSGLITLLDNKEITTTSSITENWNVTVTYINYDADQSKNAGKKFDAEIMIQKEKALTVLSDVCTSGDNLTNCITTLSSKSNPNLTNIYHHDSSLTNGAGDNSYRYAGPSDSVNNFICFGSTISPCPENNLYRIIGVIGDKVKLIKYDYMTTGELGTNGDYMVTYKVWGMNDTYKGTYGDGEKIGVYRWNYNANTTINDGQGSNTWSTSLFNKTNLNTNFINYLGTEWSNKIATTTWKVGGNTWDNIVNVIPSITYQNEITNPDTTNTTDNATTYDAKIGLMYVNDYGFAAATSAWGFEMNYYEHEDMASNNWMYMGLYEWTLSRISDDSYNVFNVNNDGNLSANVVGNIFAGRAVFNLESSITYKSGTGTMDDPILIN